MTTWLMVLNFMSHSFMSALPLSQLLQARDGRELIMIRRRYDVLDRHRTACERQFDLNEVPADCFTWLKLSYGKSAEKMALWWRAENHCRAVQVNHLSVTNLQKKIVNSHLGRQCRHHLLLGMKIRRYQEEDEAVVGLEIE